VTARQLIAIFCQRPTRSHEMLRAEICLPQTNTIIDSGNYPPDNELSFQSGAGVAAMGTVTFLAPASPQWLLLELNMMNVLRRLLGNESPFGWCDFVTSIEPSGPCAEFCDHFGPVVRLTRVGRRYEITCLRTGAAKRTANLGRAATLIRARWKSSGRGGNTGFIPSRIA